MKVYFEDGVLTGTTHLKLGCRYAINASVGYSNNEQVFDRILKDEPDVSVYTNSLVPLLYSDIYCWNKDLGVFELYIRKNDEFIRVDELTNRQLRFGHNLLRLWRAGEFEFKTEETKV